MGYFLCFSFFHLHYRHLLSKFLLLFKQVFALNQANFAMVSSSNSSDPNPFGNGLSHL